MRNLFFATLAAGVALCAACQPARAPVSTTPGALAGGGTSKLQCTPGTNFRRFDATLDASGFEPGSGYFDVRDARIMDGYATAQLLCTGHELGSIDCVGFWFGVGEEIAEVTTAADQDGGLSVTFASLKGTLVKSPTSPWPCTVNP
jgi:hypothetical protein